MLFRIYFQKPNKGITYACRLCKCVCVSAESPHLCPTVCDHMECSLPSFSCLWGFSRQEYWSALPCIPLVGLPDPVVIESMSLVSPALADGVLYQ